MSCSKSSTLVRNVHEDAALFHTTQTKYLLEEEEERKSLNGINECKNSCASSVNKIESDEIDQMTADNFSCPLIIQTDFELVQSDDDSNKGDNKHKYPSISEEIENGEKRNKFFPRLTKSLKNCFRSKKKNL